MGDLISRQAAINAINTWDKFGADERGRIVRWHEGLVIYVRLRDVLTAIVNLPAAQPQITHCAECIHWKHSDVRKNYCEVFDWMNKAEDFCSFAERRSDGN